MKTEITNITNQILSFPPNTRAYLAEVLLESLDYEENYDVSNEWLHEIKHRCDDIDNGKVELVSGQKVINSLKNK